MKNSVRFIFCLKETLNGKQNNWMCNMSTRCFLVEILLQRHDVEQTEVVYDFLFIFIIRGFTVS